jgi:hypothetical protein
MNLIELLDIPGEHSQVIEGPAGALQLRIDVPPNPNPRYLAMLGHPHSLQGGTMNNKVVTTMAKAFRELGISSIRFNFRGVEDSQGTYDAGIGESEDMLHLLRLCERPELTVFFAGFSFGSYVAFRALSCYQLEGAQRTGLITIAPPVHHYDYTLALRRSTPWLVIQGLEDEVVPTHLVSEFVQQREPRPDIEYFENTGHFFHGKLLVLKASLLTWIKTRVIAA